MASCLIRQLARSATKREPADFVVGVLDVAVGIGSRSRALLIDSDVVDVDVAPRGVLGVQHADG
jgi:hypothetical protein